MIVLPNFADYQAAGALPQGAPRHPTVDTLLDNASQRMSCTLPFQGLGASITDQLLAEDKILCGEVGFLGEESLNYGPDAPEKEHRHLLYSGIGIGAGVYSGWPKCQNLKSGRGY